MTADTSPFYTEQTGNQEEEIRMSCHVESSSLKDRVSVNRQNKGAPSSWATIALEGIFDFDNSLLDCPFETDEPVTDLPNFRIAIARTRM